MARKRKIPARKHHGIRDPLKQIEEKTKKLYNVTNNPPEIGDDQRVSYKFTQFKKLVDDTKAGKKIKRLQCGQEDFPKKSNKTSAASGNKFRNIKQFLDEKDGDYLRRVNRITTESLREAQYEAKYGVNVVRNAKTGEITVKKRPKNEIDELLKQKQNNKLASKRGKQDATKPIKPMDPAVAKELIKRAIKEDDEERKKANHVEVEEYKRDIVKFGEIVHAPPTISTLPRKAQKNETVPRPGKKNNLLLQSLLKDAAGETDVKSKVKRKSGAEISHRTPSKAQMRGKRKELPVATRSMLENERTKMVDLYRQLKKSKVSTPSNK